MASLVCLGSRVSATMHPPRLRRLILHPGRGYGGLDECLAQVETPRFRNNRWFSPGGGPPLHSCRQSTLQASASNGPDGLDFTHSRFRSQASATMATCLEVERRHRCCQARERPRFRVVRGGELHERFLRRGCRVQVLAALQRGRTQTTRLPHWSRRPWAKAALLGMGFSPMCNSAQPGPVNALRGWPNGMAAPTAALSAALEPNPDARGMSPEM